MRLRPRILDRYILSSWSRIFLLTAIGLPLTTIIIELTDNINGWLQNGLGWKRIALATLLRLPENMFEVMPAAVLFATIFTIGNLSRNTELTAVKASGVSFHRMLRPLIIASMFAAALGVVVGELAPGATRKGLEIEGKKQVQSRNEKYNFVFRADQGWVYTIAALDISHRTLSGLLLERQGTGDAFPTIVVTADSARWDSAGGHWRLWNGATRLIGQRENVQDFSFTTLRLNAMHEKPAELLQEPKDPEEMRYGELGDYIAALQRSGNDANKLIVERSLKIVLPITCIVIALFGAPLALTAPRAGAAVGLALSLGTTLVFLTLIQLSQAVGISGVVPPQIAAWFPTVLFLGLGIWLLARART